ncbi:MAG: hypothetical protein Q9225_004815, partial [Loekoesia sp. 1 TL-2023]
TEKNLLSIQSPHIHILCLLIDATMQYALSVFGSTWALDPLPSLSSCLLLLVYFLVISGIVILPITAQEVKDCSAEAVPCQTINNSILGIVEYDHPHDTLSGGAETNYGLPQHLDSQDNQWEHEQVRRSRVVTLKGPVAPNSAVAHHEHQEEHVHCYSNLDAEPMFKTHNEVIRPSKKSIKANSHMGKVLVRVDKITTQRDNGQAPRSTSVNSKAGHHPFLNASDNGRQLSLHEFLVAWVDTGITNVETMGIIARAARPENTSKKHIQRRIEHSINPDEITKSGTIKLRRRAYTPNCLYKLLDGHTTQSTNGIAGALLAYRPPPHPIRYHQVPSKRQEDEKVEYEVVSPGAAQILERNQATQSRAPEPMAALPSNANLGVAEDKNQESDTVDSGTKDIIDTQANTPKASFHGPEPTESYGAIYGSVRLYEIPADIFGRYEPKPNTFIPESGSSGIRQAGTIQPITTQARPADSTVLLNGFRIQIPWTATPTPHLTSSPPVIPSNNTTMSSSFMAESSHQNDPAPSVKETKVEDTKGASAKKEQPVEPPKPAKTEQPAEKKQAAAPSMPAEANREAAKSEEPSLNATSNLPASSTSSSSSASKGDKSVGEQPTIPTRFSPTAARDEFRSSTAESPTEATTADPSPSTSPCPSPISNVAAPLDVQLLLVKLSLLVPNKKHTEAKPSPFSLNTTANGAQNPADEPPTVEEYYGYDPYAEHLLPTTPVEESGAVIGEEAPKVNPPEIPTLAPRPRRPISPRPLSASRWAHDLSIPLPLSTEMDCEPDEPEPPLAYLSSSVGHPNGTTTDPPRPVTPPSPAPTLDDEGDEILSDADDVSTAECSSPDVEMLDSPSEDESDEDTVMSDVSSSSSRTSSRRSFRVNKRGRQAQPAQRRASEHLEAPKQPRLSPPVKPSRRPRSKSPYRSLRSGGLRLLRTQPQVTAY